MKITKEQLKEMVRNIVKAKLNENSNAKPSFAGFGRNELHAIHRFVDTGGEAELPSEVMNKLMDMYEDEMPLDVKQGNTGTPEEWLFKRLDLEFPDHHPTLEEAKTVKISANQLKEMVRNIVGAELNEEAKKDAAKDMPEKWVKYMKDVEDLLGDVIDKAKELHEEGEKIKAEERKLDRVANPINSARSNHYEYVDERSTALKSLVAQLAHKLEAWKSRY